MVELWIDAHPKSSSQILDVDGQTVVLRGVIEHDKSALLGEVVAQRSGELPSPSEVLYAAQSLSIQAYPNKRNSEVRLTKENATGIPIDAAERNYKDPNHKPEPVFALTSFLAMNALRRFSDIVTLLRPASAAHPATAYFLGEPSTKRLSYSFASLLNVQDEEKSHALVILKSALNSQRDEPRQIIRLIADVYPNDSGLFSPLLLNVVKLNPGRTMPLFAETPHAYLQGVAFEVVANLGNVLRAGLAPRCINIPELVANVEFVAKPTNQSLTTPVESDDELNFPIPVDDLAFSLHELTTSGTGISQQSAVTLFYIGGEVVLSKDEQRLVPQPGESAFIGANESPVSISGTGRLARVYNKLQ